MAVLRKIGFAFVCILAANTEAGARTYTGSANLDNVWQQYLVEDAHREPGLTFPYMHCFRRAARDHSVPVSLLLAVARGESDFDPNARSKANAHGLMQILWPQTAKDLGFRRLSELYQPCRNVDAGARYLKMLLQRYDGNLHLALAAYNYGPSRISASHVPDGAEWYSGYIYRHLGFVLAQRGKNDSTLYSEEGKLTLAVFGEPYRAAAFVESLESSAPDLRLDWFRRGVGNFEVMLFYDGREAFDKSVSLLSQAGFPVTEP